MGTLAARIFKPKQRPAHSWQARAAINFLYMQEVPLNLDALLARLRAAAADHTDAALATPVPARPWAIPGALGAAAPVLPWGVVARAGGLAPYWLVDDAAFTTLAYQRLLGRAPDDGGAAHFAERLRQHVPRTELLAGLAVSSEARQQYPQGQVLQRLLALLLLGGLRVARGLRADWLARGVLRRTERWLARRAQRSPLGLAWYLATRHDAAVYALQGQLAVLQAQLDISDQIGIQPLPYKREQL